MWANNRAWVHLKITATIFEPFMTSITLKERNYKDPEQYTSHWWKYSLSVCKNKNIPKKTNFLEIKLYVAKNAYNKNSSKKIAVC